MIDNDHMKMAVFAISGMLETLQMDTEAKEIVDNAIEKMHELMEEVDDLQHELSRTKDSLYQEKKRTEMLNVILTQEFSERGRDRATAALEMKGQWLKQLKSLIEAWEHEVSMNTSLRK